MDTKVARIPAALHERAAALARELNVTTAEAIERLIQDGGPAHPPVPASQPVEVEVLEPRREAFDVTHYLLDVDEHLERIERQQAELAVRMTGLQAGQLEIVRESSEERFKARVLEAMARDAERRGLGNDGRRVLQALEALSEGGHDA